MSSTAYSFLPENSSPPSLHGARRRRRARRGKTSPCPPLLPRRQHSRKRASLVLLVNAVLIVYSSLSSSSSSHPLFASAGTVIINEVSDKGTDEGDCGGHDWVELYHVPFDETDTSEPFSLGGYMLHDRNGPSDPGAFVFPRGEDGSGINSILPGHYLVLCAGEDAVADLAGETASLPQVSRSGVGGGGGGFVISSASNGGNVGPGAITAVGPLFGIGSTDTITLKDPFGGVVSSAGPFPGSGRYGNSYVRIPASDNEGSGRDDAQYDYTARPTPGGPNVYVSLYGEDSSADGRKEEMRRRNDRGAQFFGMDVDGRPVPDAFEAVLDLKVEMDEEDYDDMMAHRARRTYKPFRSVEVLSRSTGDALLTLPSSSAAAAADSRAGRIRTKGAWTLVYSTCLGLDTIPFSIDFGDGIDNGNADETSLFGVRRAYLRNHVADASYMREWVQHRMLARVGLPYLRTRKVRFFVNGRLLGLYDLMESPDQEYVFARSFPEYDPYDHALYKVKNSSIRCGTSSAFTPDNIAAARQIVDAENENVDDPSENSPSPYAWERGDHQPDVPVYGAENWQQCSEYFTTHFGREDFDKVLAYVRHGEDCAESVVEENLIDRDLSEGSGSGWDEAVKEFYRNRLGSFQCDSREDCAEAALSELGEDDVDVDNFLQAFAFYAVTLNMDSPMQGGKNYYLANAGGRGGSKRWSIVPYDLDNALSGIGAGICSEECQPKMVRWSVLRPTCQDVHTSQLAGPFLSRLDLRDRYLTHVRTIVDIMSDPDFVREIETHARAIQPDVEEDAFAKLYYLNYDMETSEDAASWDTDWTTPLLPVMKARAEAVTEELDAIAGEDGTEGGFPVVEKVGSEEICVDSRDVPTSSCVMGCVYDGCHEPSWTVSSYCDEEQGVCYRGNDDPLCEGVPNLNPYPGMEPNRVGGGQAPYCWEGRLTMVCPPPRKEVWEEDGGGSARPQTTPRPETAGDSTTQTTTPATQAEEEGAAAARSASARSGRGEAAWWKHFLVSACSASALSLAWKLL